MLFVESCKKTGNGWVRKIVYKRYNLKCVFRSFFYDRLLLILLEYVRIAVSSANSNFFSICRAKRIYFCLLCWTHSFISSNILAATCCYFLLENGLEKCYVHTRVTIRLGEISKALLFCIQRLANANCMHKKEYLI